MRGDFQEEYRALDAFLKRLGFVKPDDYRSNVSQYRYSYYDEILESITPVEWWEHKLLRIELYFIRGSKEHKILEIGVGGANSVAIPLHEFMDNVRTQVLAMLDAKIETLTTLRNEYS